MIGLISGFILSAATVALLTGCSKGTDIVEDDTPDDDVTPPATIADFHAIQITTTTATLGWTAPGDDSTEGIVKEYDLRGSQDSITASNFSQAYRIDSVVFPIPAGLSQVCTVEDLQPGTSYFFAVKACDEVDNWSDISNCVRVDCPLNPVVVFPDDALDSLVRELIGVPSGDIHVSDVDIIATLSAGDAGISDVTGLEYFTALTMLHLSFNSISDLTPLQGLIALKAIHVVGNDITDLSPLAGLVNLESVIAGQNPVSDITVLAGLTKLKSVSLNDCDVTDFSPLYSLPVLEGLDIHSNPLGNISFMANLTHLKVTNLSYTQISDITPLAGLTDLETLYLTSNQISGITVLTNLINLTELDLRTNQITDISPLVDNTGLDTDDIVWLQSNPLSDESLNTHIPALVARGVVVNY